VSARSAGQRRGRAHRERVPGPAPKAGSAPKAELAPKAGPAADEPPRHGLLALGVGLAAAGAGAVLGLAAERLTAGRLLGGSAMNADGGLIDPRGGPPLGSLHGEAHVVMTADEVPLHVEVDEPGGGERGDRPGGRGALAALGLGRGHDPVTVVLTHGYALTLDSWHYQRLALRENHRLVLWDQRGHGRSGTGEEGSSTIDQVGHDLGAVIDAVVPKGPLVLLGHSMGGMTVMSLAHQRPDLFAERVVGIGLVSTSAGGLGELDLGLAGFGRLVLRAAPVAARVLARRPDLVAQGRRVGSDLEGLLVRRYSFASEVPSALVRFSAAMIAGTRLEVISEFLPAFSSHDKREALDAMSGIEVLVMVGDRDLLTPAVHSEEIVRRLPAAEHIVVRRGGHLLMLEHPDIVNEHVTELIGRAERAVRATGTTVRRLPWGRRTVTPVRVGRGQRTTGSP
jgi:pimeloyl-ACP methyl ester carboxylesterase